MLSYAGYLPLTGSYFRLTDVIETKKKELKGSVAQVLSFRSYLSLIVQDYCFYFCESKEPRSIYQVQLNPAVPDPRLKEFLSDNYR